MFPSIIILQYSIKHFFNFHIIFIYSIKYFLSSQVNEKSLKMKSRRKFKVPDKGKQRTFEKRVTHQSDEEEEHEKCSSQHGLAEHVAVADGGHRDDEKINTCPIG